MLHPVVVKIKQELEDFRKDLDTFFSYFDDKPQVVVNEVVVKLDTMKAKVETHIANYADGLAAENEAAAAAAQAQIDTAQRMAADHVAAGGTASSTIETDPQPVISPPIVPVDPVVKTLDQMSVDEMLVAGYSEAQVEAIQSARADNVPVPSWASLPDANITGAPALPQSLGEKEDGAFMTEDEMKDAGFTEEQIIAVLLARDEADE